MGLFKVSHVQLLAVGKKSSSWILSVQELSVSVCICVCMYLCVKKNHVQAHRDVKKDDHMLSVLAVAVETFVTSSRQHVDFVK